MPATTSSSPAICWATSCKTPWPIWPFPSSRERFGRAKLESLPGCCRQCEVLFACHGECPKNRFLQTPDGEPGLNYLCAGYKSFFGHIDGPLKILAQLLRRGLPATQVMQVLAQADGQPVEACGKVGRNAPCPCGSGLKFKKCHGRGAPGSRQDP
ncbi:MAG: SEC-C metal-binding domain-containing protein [Desulfobacterales bacterium]|nr:SEC-C metal-binding domain-containing protein [Desulfobacterales bacterium]